MCVTLIPLGIPARFPDVLSSKVKAPFLFNALCFPMSLFDEKMRHLPFTCWGEYGSELESGGDSGRLLEHQTADDVRTTAVHDRGPNINLI